LTCDFLAKNAKNNSGGTANTIESFTYRLEQAEGRECGLAKVRQRQGYWYFFFRDGVGFGFGVKGAVEVEELFAGDGGDTVAGNDDAGEIHGVGGGDRDDGGTVAAAGGAKGFDGFGESVLFAAEAGEEAAAADLAACFEAAEDVEEVAPFGGVGFAGEEVAEEDAVTGEELTGEGFQGRVGAAGLFDCGWGSVEFFGE
jgi:hypothetical protein